MQTYLKDKEFYSHRRFRTFENNVYEFLSIHLHQRCLVDAGVLIYYDSPGGMESCYDEAIYLASFEGGLYWTSESEVLVDVS